VYPDRAIEFFLRYHSNVSIEHRAANGLILVAEQNGEIVATGSVTGNEISGVFVRSTLQGEGIGGLVMDELESHVKKAGFENVILSISLPSRVFYEKRGYEIVKTAEIDVDMGQFLKYWEGRKMLLPMAIQQSTNVQITMKPIGIIHSPYHSKDECPIQPLYASGVIGRAEVFGGYEAGLKDIETFSHVYLLYRFDRAGETQMIRSTFLDDKPHGIFATRHPCRPNGIGMSIVRLISKDQNVLEVEGIDILDKTPLLDIKPYIPRFDRIETASEGWVAGKEWCPKPQDRE